MARHRDRHARGMRTMLAPPNCPAGRKLRWERPTLSTRFFFRCFAEAMSEITKAYPTINELVSISVEDVPDMSQTWLDRVPLATATSDERTGLAQLVIYRRPIELRAGSRSHLPHLIFSTLVEELSVVTGISAQTLDPKNLRGE